MDNNLLKRAYQDAVVIRTGSHLTTVNELCDQVPALRPNLLRHAAMQLCRLGQFNCDKILSEEDKGAPIATAVALMTDLPLCMARWYPYKIPGQTQVKLSNEYFEGNLYLNGVNAGDRVTIVEDTVSTGGTMIALIAAVRQLGAEVVEAIALVEKEGMGGVANVATDTGVIVRTAMKIKVSQHSIIVV